ncbi:MAG: hypothetical protein QOJ65_2663 [Fimbriimonadaceae bacterium]|jgi:AraC family transcriptional regulator|nr:hypothetical protein [Fimbriimonadaceae bacterium]
MGVIGVPARRWLTKADLYSQMEKAKAFMDTCALDDVDVSKCADAAGLSLHHFLRLFHEVHRVTPHQYLATRRICVAKQLLEETEMSVSQIAAEVGFGGVSAFGRMFRNQVGCSPSAYRKANSQDR